MKLVVIAPDEGTTGTYQFEITRHDDVVIDATIDEDVVDSASEAYVEAVADPTALRFLADLLEDDQDGIDYGESTVDFPGV